MEDVLRVGCSRGHLSTWLQNGVAVRHGQGVFVPRGVDLGRVRLEKAMFGGSRIAPLLHSARVHSLWLPAEVRPELLRPLLVRSVHGAHTQSHGSLTICALAWTALNLARGAMLPDAVLALSGGLNRGFSKQLMGELLQTIPAGRGTAILPLALNLANGAVESPLEAFALGVFHTLGLPAPHAQLELSIRGNRFRPDFAWVDRKLVVEVDGEVKYQDRGEISYERRRQRELEAAGWRVVRLTWKDLNDRRSAGLTHLASLFC